MKESDERWDPRRQGRAHSVLAIGVLLMMVSGAAGVAYGIVDGWQGWSHGFGVMILGPALYLVATGGAVAGQGGQVSRIIRMLRRSRGAVIALAVLAAAANLYEGIRGAVPWWLALLMAAACCSMAMALRQLSSTAS